MSFELKHVGNAAILFTMAVEAEYGPHLKALFKPLMSGVGPVESAITVTRALSHLEAQDRRPNLIVCLGSAGSAKLEQTKVYQASSLSYRDIDASPLGFEKGATPFVDLPVTVQLSAKIPNVPTASLSSGGEVITGAAYNSIDADMVDMESFAVMRAAMQFSLPFIGLRGISDGTEELKKVEDWSQYLHIVDKNLAATVMLLEQALLKNTLSF